MPRGKRTTLKLDTPAKRAALPARHHPYWQPIHRGLQLGYQQPRSGPGTWRMRAFVPSGDGGGSYAYDVIGPAIGQGSRTSLDERAIDYPEASKLAIEREARVKTGNRRGRDAGSTETTYRYETAGPRTYTIGDLLHDHAVALRVAGKAGAAEVARNADGPLFASISSILVAKVTSAQLVGWRDRLASSAPLRRSKPGAAKLSELPVNADAEARRRRRVRVNRLVTDLRAAFSRIAPLAPWLPADAEREFARLTKFEDVGRGRVRPLNADEVSRLLAAIDDERFKDLVRGALLTGARVAELTRLRVVDYDRATGKVRFPKTKDEPEKGRPVALSPEGVELFDRLTAGRAPEAILFERAAGAAWSTNTHIRPMTKAVKRAKLSPLPHRPTFHNLRDTFACALLRGEVSMDRVSKILGHSSVTLTEKHYAEFAESDLDAAARSLPRFEQPPAKVSPIAGRRRRA